MKKILFLAISTILMFSCSSDSNENNSSSNSPYSPPAWIQGTWGLKANGSTITNDIPYYKFTSNNVCQLSGGFTTMCWKEQVEQSNNTMSGSNTVTTSTYEASLIPISGATVTLSFEKISATKILWLSSPSNLELEKL